MTREEYYMTEALLEAKKALAKDEVPIGAVAVHQDRIIGRGHNERETLKDPTRHAEITAIQEAAHFLGGWRLTDVELYVTIEPCVMCSGAALQARLKRIIYGAKDPKGGGVHSLYEIPSDQRLNHQIEVLGGVLEEECRQLMQDFFRGLRQ
jgi:tRNA(adenine34) deaminase